MNCEVIAELKRAIESIDYTIASLDTIMEDVTKTELAILKHHDAKLHIRQCQDELTRAKHAIFFCTGMLTIYPPEER